MSANFLYLSEDDVQARLPMSLAVAAVEQAFAALGNGTAVNVPRFRAASPGIVLHSMSAASTYLGLVGWKNYTTTKHGAVFHVGIYEQSSGRLLALIEANRLGQIRTGAATGVAAKYLARATASSVGIFGSGWQAETQLEALAVVRRIQHAFVFSRNVQRREDFSQRMSARLGFAVTPVSDPRQAVEAMDIVVTATTSRTPVFQGEWLSPGALVCAVGSNWLEKSEIDLTTIRRSSRIVCDSLAACQHEAGDFVPAVSSGDFAWDKAEELADIVIGKRPTRSDTNQIILFKSVGLAVEDLAVADVVLRRSPAAQSPTA